MAQPLRGSAWLGWIVAGWVVAGCTSTLWRAKYIQPAEYQSLDRGMPFLKCHTAGGEVYVLGEWTVDAEGKLIRGDGIRYDRYRNVVQRGHLQVPFPDVALLETNQPESVNVRGTHFAVMGVLTGASVLGTALCLANPKACFGSCPTFYAHDGKKETLQAEAFSSSVARVLEKTDVDALYTARSPSRRFELRMTNDALETHLVRSVALLAARRSGGGRVHRAAGGFYSTFAESPPLGCVSDQGDCLSLVRSVDDLEYLSPTDGNDLAAKEMIELTFPAPRGEVGLIVAGRNSLLNTFLFYQTLAYMGLSAGEWFMKLERGGEEATSILDEIGELLGDVEAMVLTRDRGWVRAGFFGETGPIAREVQLVPLPADLPDGEVRVRLRMTRGNWKLDYLALTELGEQVTPMRLEVSEVLRAARPDAEALQRLRNPDTHLVTYPGDDYTLVFVLPEGDWELFLEARGFYYEWIRTQWLSEEDHGEVARILLEPGEALRRLAPRYKELEPSMEAVFWQSRVGR